MPKKQKKTIKEEIEEIIKKEWRPGDGVPPSFVADQIYALFRQTLQRFIEETTKEELKHFKDGGYTEFGKGWLRGIIDGYNQALRDIEEKINTMAKRKSIGVSAQKVKKVIAKSILRAEN